MVPFAGWEMPLQYEPGAIREHHLVRRSVGLFDISHMGRFRIGGTAATRQLDSVVSSNLAAVEVGTSSYGLLCNEDGGVIDDVFAYRREDGWLLVVNAANRKRDAEWLSDHFLASDVVLEEISDQSAMIAVQGPLAIRLVDTVSARPVSELARFAIVTTEVASCVVDIGRTGYTGEDGVELIVPRDHAIDIWELLLDAARQERIESGPVGLAARDSLRFEAGFALYGHELRQDITPIEARLKWACAFETEFVGRDALLSPPSDEERRLATVRMTERGVPREGFVVASEGEPVGWVASGMYAPTVDECCANVFVPRALAKIGQELDIVIRDRPRRAVVVKRPLYKPKYR